MPQRLPAQSRTILNIFVSSPGDVAMERQAVSQVVDDMNKSVAPKLNITLDVDKSEGFRPRANFREHVEARLRAADLFVMIFAHRYGEAASDPELGSGTREEFEIAKALRNEHGRPEIAVYFLDMPSDHPMVRDPGSQFAEVLAFKEELSHQVFYQPYPSAELFALKFARHLTEWIFDEWEKSVAQSQPTRRKKLLRGVFRLSGDPPSATIIHPARREQSGTNLLPWVAAEDFHAIRKITDCLHLAGCADVTTCTDTQYADFAEHYPSQNQIYLCAFLNSAALESLKAQKRCSFRLESLDRRRSGRTIIWKGLSGEETVVKSPLAAYLKAQGDGDPSAYKRGRMGVDFAVLARYRDGDDRDAMCSMYAFGLRSLGTWGAAWFLERELTKTDIPADRGRTYEALLRVEYSGSTIARVTDVSNESQEFFTREMSQEFIRGQVERR